MTRSGSSPLPSALSAAWIRKTFSAPESTPVATPRTSLPGLLDFVPQITPRWNRPGHLAPLAKALESAVDKPIECVISVPPRHGKTETVLHWIAWLLLQDPTKRIAYISYAERFAAKQARKGRKIAQRAGVAMGEVAQAGYWETAAGGCVQATGVRGQLTGEGFHVIVVDDPVKNRREAESPTIRESSWEGFQNDIYTRQEPTGTSVIVVQTRWHPDDIAGHCIREGFEVINLPALDQDDEALAPGMWPAEKLLKIRKRVGPYAWESLYQGNPRPRGGAVFGPPSYCELRDIPTKGRIGFGVDLAYTKKTYADRSVAVRCIESLERRDGLPVYYVADVVSEQLDAPAFTRILKRKYEPYKGAPMWWHAAGTEKGAADFIRRDIPQLHVEAATSDKFVRAQPVAAAWNDGRVLVPHDAPWAARYVEVMCNFTGLDDPEDDEVDATASAHASLGAVQVKSFRIKGL